MGNVFCISEAVSETGQNSWSVTLTYTDTASQVCALLHGS